MFEKEAFRLPEEFEGVTEVPPVVEELALFRSPEAGHPEETLGEVGKKPVRAAEEHDRGAKKRIPFQKPETAQDRLRLPRARVLDASDADAFVQGPPDLFLVEVRNRPAGSRLELPP